jgi:hypothetical protein
MHILYAKPLALVRQDCSVKGVALPRNHLRTRSGSGFASSARNSSCRPSSLDSSSLSVLADTPSAIASTIFLRRASRTAIACSTAEFWPAGPRRPNAFFGFIKLDCRGKGITLRKEVGRLASKTAAQAEIKTPSPGFCGEGASHRISRVRRGDGGSADARVPNISPELRFGMRPAS